MARNYAALPYDYLEEMEELTDAEFGRLARALLKYSMTGQKTALSGSERYFMKRVMNQEDRFKSSYDDLADKRREAGKKGADTRWQNMANDGKGMANDGKAIANDSKNGYTETETNTKTNIEKDTPKSPRKTPPEEEKPMIREIIDYLNEKAGTNYKYSKTTTKHINARISEKFTLDDFKTVIDKKCTEWLGDPKMQQYLRPETLFGTKFEAYLNAPAGGKYHSNKRETVLPEYYNADPNRKMDGEKMTDEELEEMKALLSQKRGDV